jgi:UDP-glucose 4-epimerase
VHDFIEKAKQHVIINTCGCRLAFKCKNHSHEIGCLFMGETALDMPPGISRRVTKKEAHAHVEKAIANGLVPMVGKVRVDNFIFLTPDLNRLLSVCFCCHCCCMMGFYRHIPEEHLNEMMVPIEGIEVTVTDRCKGCGTCIKTCIFKAITLENGRAVHGARCRGCGRCRRYCPNNAVELVIKNPDFAKDVEKRIGSYVDLS